MSSGADLFVVCKRCGSEVSPYITECPYCGNRLRRRAPKLPREHTPQRASHRARLPVPSLGRLRRGEIEGVRAELAPYATIALVAASCVLWVLTSGGYVSLGRIVVVGPLQGDWWKLLTTQFGYAERVLRGRLRVLRAPRGGDLRLAAGAPPRPLRGARHVLRRRRHRGARGARGLPAADRQPAPTPAPSRCSRRGPSPTSRPPARERYYDGDLLGTAMFAAVLLAMPFARWEASWLAGVTGGAVGAGAGLRSPVSTRARDGVSGRTKRNTRSREAESNMEIRFLGHAAFELRDGDTTVLIDPFLTGNPKAAVAAEELSPDAILLTHGHARSPRRHRLDRQAHRRGRGGDRGDRQRAHRGGRAERARPQPRRHRALRLGLGAARARLAHLHHPEGHRQHPRRAGRGLRRQGRLPPRRHRALLRPRSSSAGASRSTWR